MNDSMIKPESTIILTNNPLVVQRHPGNIPVEFLDTDYRGVLVEVRDRVHRGALLLVHPLYGSVKPGETPYRSIIIRECRGETDLRSLKLIESALEECDKFPVRSDVFGAKAEKDFRLVDYSLLTSGVSGLY